MCGQVINQALLAHVCHDNTGRVIGAFAVSFVFRQQVLKNFTEHFRVNRDIGFQRLGFVDCEVVAVEDIENASANITIFRLFAVGKKLIWQQYICMHPVIISQRLEQSAIEERDFAAKTVGVIVISFLCKSVVKERFEDVIEVILIRPFRIEQVAKIILFARAPLRVTFDAEPALLLQEIKKNDLAQQFLGEIVGLDRFALEFGAHFGVTLDEAFERRFSLLEEFSVSYEEFFSNLLDIEGFLDLFQRRIALVVFEQRQELFLRRVAAFVRAYQE